MGRSWLRRITVQGPTTITGGRDGELTIDFSIKMWHSGSPNEGRIRVYNPSPGTVEKWKKAEGQKVTLTGGYEDLQGVLFTGEIRQVNYGHNDNSVDAWIDVFAADGDQQYRKAIVTKTLPRGWKPQDKVDAALEAMKPFGVTMGLSNLDLSQPKYPRGTPLIGLARGLLREVTLSANGLWSVQQGKLMLTKKDLDTGNSGTFKLTPETGLVGYPVQTADGISFRSLINPALVPLCKVQLDPSQIIAAERDNNPFSKEAFDTNVNLTSQQLGAGIYTVYKMDRFGITRGFEYYDECIAIGQGGILPTNVSSSEPGYMIGDQ